MIKILFIINALGGGGAERVMVNLINNMDKNKFDITVGTMFADGVNRDMICDDVKCYCKNKLGIKGLSNIIKFIPSNVLYKYYVGKEKYDIVVAYMHGAPTKVVAGCNNKDIKTVTWLHYGNPKESSFFSFWNDQKKAFDAYASLDAIVGVSKSVTVAFSEYTDINEKLYTLYNTNDTQRIVDMSREPCDFKENESYPVIVTAGRLTNQKGFDRLISAAKRLWNEGLRFKIKILGDGPEKKNLIETIKNCSAEEYVEMLGFCENPYNIMINSDLYISSSREEGLATVLTEALTLGLPVVSTDVSGAKEVLGENNEYGLVVENSKTGVYEGLKKLLTDSELMEKYRKTAKERAEEFDTAHTVAKTEEFFESLVK